MDSPGSSHGFVEAALLLWSFGYLVTLMAIVDDCSLGKNAHVVACCPLFASILGKMTSLYLLGDTVIKSPEDTGFCVLKSTQWRQCCREEGQPSCKKSAMGTPKLAFSSYSVRISMPILGTHF